MGVVNLNERRLEKQYNEFYGQKCSNFDVSMDISAHVKKEKRNYARELTVGYMKLLSNQK